MEPPGKFERAHQPVSCSDAGGSYRRAAGQKYPLKFLNAVQNLSSIFSRPRSTSSGQALTGLDRTGSGTQDFILGLEFLHFWSSELAGGRRFAVFINEQLKLCQPRTSVRGSGFSNPRERSDI
jgi:hypothetical protein